MMIRFHRFDLSHKLAEYKLMLITLFFAGVFADVFFLSYSSDIRLFGLLILWIYVSKLYRFSSVVTFKTTLVYLVVLFVVFIVSRNGYRLERISTWIYLFLILGLIQQFREITSS